jgi:sec-independent protein translocase protein TatA
MIGDILQPTHLLFVLIVALLVLGPKRLPEASRAIGKGIRDFRMAVSGEEPDHTAITTPATTASVMTATAPAAQAPAADPAVIASETAFPAFTEAQTEPTNEPTEPAQPVA